MERTLFQRAFYSFLHVICRLAFVTAFHGRVEGRENLPRSGGALVLSNHQSHLDPLLVGLAADRRLNFVARQTLYKFKPFGWLIRTLDAIPIDRDGSGLGGLKETLKRLKRGEAVLLFPEGTRTPDGEVQPLKPGFCAIARRAGVPIVPVAIDGAFEAWPRSQPVPGLATIHIVFGQPIHPDKAQSMTDDELVDEVYRRLNQCLAAARICRSKPATAH